jgi:hypothetical protein
MSAIASSTCSTSCRLLGGPPDSVDEYVDQLMADLWAYAGEHCLYALSGARVGATDYWLGLGGDGQLHASTVVRVRRAAH